MRRLLLFLILSWTPLYGQSQTSLPLNDNEKRQIIGQLIELRACRESVSAYEEFVKRELDLYEKERANWQRGIELEKQATVLAQKERDLALEKAKFYEDAFRTVSRKPGGFWCGVKKLFSFGMYRCK
jgi:hypothetical protein